MPHRFRTGLHSLRVRAALLALTLSAPAVVDGQPRMPAEERDSARVRLVRDVSYLANEKLEGRATGSPGSDSAANYLAQSYVAMQVDAGFRTAQCDSTGACRRSYLQGFLPPAAILKAAGIDSSARAYNILAIVPGTDSAVSREWLVVGAHYDHLGRTGYGARDGRSALQAHLGADDNASGTAAVLELARRVAASPLRRSVMFAHFGAEELGVIGSSLFLLDPPVPTVDMVAMINLDMVGRLERGRLRLFGLGSAPEWRGLVDRASAIEGLRVSRDDALGPPGTGSDHVPFFHEGIPVVHLSTGMHSGYHTKHDTVERIDFEGLLRVVEFAERLVRLLGDGDTVPGRRGRASSR